MLLEEKLNITLITLRYSSSLDCSRKRVILLRSHSSRLLNARLTKHKAFYFWSSMHLGNGTSCFSNKIHFKQIKSEENWKPEMLQKGSVWWTFVFRGTRILSVKFIISSWLRQFIINYRHMFLGDQWGLRSFFFLSKISFLINKSNF